MAVNSRLYKYFFLDVAMPITIPAESKHQARWLLDQLIVQHPEYSGRPIVEEKITTLVTGVTTYEENGRKYLWSGAEVGWKLVN